MNLSCSVPKCQLYKIGLRKFRPTHTCFGMLANEACHMTKQGDRFNLHCSRERSGSVVECLTGDRRAAGSSLTGETAFCP